MRGVRRAAWGVVIVGSLAVAAAACGGSDAGHRGRGTVEHVDPQARKVTLEHEDIPGLMKAMTMTFEVAPGVVIGDLEPDVEVEFRVREEGGAYVVTEIRPSGP